MPSRLGEIFQDQPLAETIRRKLPRMFTLAELEASRGGIIGMQVGSIRELILVALLMYKFGEDNVQTELSITSPEVDLLLLNEPISIKTGTGATGPKVKWTANWQQAMAIYESYYPQYEILLAQIQWDLNLNDIRRLNRPSGLFWIPLSAQIDLFHELGHEGYLSRPSAGTNPRGVSLKWSAVRSLVHHQDTKRIEIIWERAELEYDPYRKWQNLWQE